MPSTDRLSHGLAETSYGKNPAISIDHALANRPVLIEKYGLHFLNKPTQIIPTIKHWKTGYTAIEKTHRSMANRFRMLPANVIDHAKMSSWPGFLYEFHIVGMDAIRSENNRKESVTAGEPDNAHITIPIMAPATQ